MKSVWKFRLIFGAPLTTPSVNRLAQSACVKRSPKRAELETGEGSMRAFTCIQSLALRLRKDEAGAIATEYAFLAAFIVIVAAFLMTLWVKT